MLYLNLILVMTRDINWSASILSKDFLATAKRNFIYGSLGLPLDDLEARSWMVELGNWRMYDFFYHCLQEYKLLAGSNATMKSLLVRLHHLNLDHIVG